VEGEGKDRKEKDERMPFYSLSPMFSVSVECCLLLIFLHETNSTCLSHSGYVSGGILQSMILLCGVFVMRLQKWVYGSVSCLE